MLPKPVIAIIGTTGVGKTKLSIELALRLKTEVINVDAMQMYKGFDIVTNKATPEERRLVPHHLIDFVEVDEEYQVQDFERDALTQVFGALVLDRWAALYGEGADPCRGTHYYIQSLLWKASLINPSLERAGAAPVSVSATERIQELQKGWQRLSNQALLAELAKVDPKMAEHWHPNDRRKITRGLTVFYETGKPQSEWILERAKAPGGGKELRFDTLFLWLFASKAQLDVRLDERVDAMVERGLLDELERFRKLRSTLPGGERDYDRGLQQAIGFKAFDEYFRALETRETSAAVEKLKIKGLEVMKQQTRKYAKRQVGWIRNQLLPLYFGSPQFPTTEDPVLAPGPGPLAKVYLLDATDVASWRSQVQAKAFAIVEAILSTRRGPDPVQLNNLAADELRPPSNLKVEPVISTWVKRLCEECSRRVDKRTKQLVDPVIVNGEREWEVHLKSKAHRQQVIYNRHRALVLHTQPTPKPMGSIQPEIDKPSESHGTKSFELSSEDEFIPHEALEAF
ncbi:tRNA dimethylallyltransferase, mitochondrial [Massospora cicadina]|nr:tRNA dimethylallyltransferase, mitochondrial [Massospora cicadina]